MYSEFNPPDKGDVGGFRQTANFFRGGFIPYDSRLIDLARQNRRNPTVAEKIFWYKILSQKQYFPYKFLRQKPIDCFILDFYCAELLLAIEIDGDSHALQIEYDEERTKKLEEHGISVIRYTNDEVLNNLEGLFEDLIKRIQWRAKEMGGPS